MDFLQSDRFSYFTVLNQIGLIQVIGLSFALLIEGRSRRPLIQFKIRLLYLDGIRVNNNRTPFSLMTSERYFLPSSAYNFSCLQKGDSSWFLVLTLFQYLLGELGSTRMSIKSTAEYHHKDCSLSHTVLTS